MLPPKKIVKRYSVNLIFFSSGPFSQDCAFLVLLGRKWSALEVTPTRDLGTGGIGGTFPQILYFTISENLPLLFQELPLWLNKTCSHKVSCSPNWRCFLWPWPPLSWRLLLPLFIWYPSVIYQMWVNLLLRAVEKYSWPRCENQRARLGHEGMISQ